MNSEGRNNLKLLGLVMAALLLVSAITYATLKALENTELEEALNKEKVIAESRLSERLLAEKEVAHLTTELASLRERSTADNRNHEATQSELALARQQLNRLNTASHSVAGLRSGIQELEKTNGMLEQRMAAYQVSEKQLQASRDEFELALATAEREAEDARIELERLTAEGRPIREALIETTTRNGKLTVKAKRTKTITLRGELPHDIENPSFRVYNPDGKELKDTDGMFTSYLSGSEQKKSTGFNRFQMTFRSKNKLVAGLYTFHILENSGLVGSLQVKLR